MHDNRRTIKFKKLFGGGGTHTGTHSSGSNDYILGRHGYMISIASP